MTSASVRRSPLLRFVLHYLEMVVAMVVGMMALTPLWPDAWLARRFGSLGGAGGLVREVDVAIGASRPAARPAHSAARPAQPVARSPSRSRNSAAEASPVTCPTAR